MGLPIQEASPDLSPPCRNPQPHCWAPRAPEDIMETRAALYSMDVSLGLAWPWGAPGGSFLSLFSEPSDQLLLLSEPQMPRLQNENSRNTSIWRLLWGLNEVIMRSGMWEMELMSEQWTLESARSALSPHSYT